MQAVGDGRPQHCTVRVARLLAEEDHLRLLALERFRKREARRDEVGALRRSVVDEHGAIGAHRESLAQRVERLLRTEGHEHDFPLALLQP